MCKRSPFAGASTGGYEVDLIANGCWPAANLKLKLSMRRIRAILTSMLPNW